MRIIAYDGSVEEQLRISEEQEKEGYMLVEVQNITEGNFLGFVLKEGYTPPTQPQPGNEISQLRQEIAETKETVEDLVTTMAEFMMGGE